MRGMITVVGEETVAEIGTVTEIETGIGIEMAGETAVVVEVEVPGGSFCARFT